MLPYGYPAAQASSQSLLGPDQERGEGLDFYSPFITIPLILQQDLFW